MNSDYWQNQYANGGGAHADQYDGWLDRYPFSAGEQVLDLGCGAGANLSALLSFGLKISAGDFSENGIRQVREQFAGQICSADCFDMRQTFPYPQCCFDAVVSDLSLHYFSWEDTRRIVSEIHRVLRPGGQLIARLHSVKNLDAACGDPIEPGYYLAYGFPRRYFTPDEVRKLFDGWKILTLEETTANRYNRIKHVIEFAAEKA